MRLGHIARYLPLLQECPGPRGGLPTLYCPFRHFPHRCIATTVGFVRLACLIHAANVRSEPGSNPSKVFASRGCPRVDPTILQAEARKAAGLGSATDQSLRSPGKPTQRTCDRLLRQGRPCRPHLSCKDASAAWRTHPRAWLAVYHVVKEPRIRAFARRLLRSSW